ncbi:MAG: hypothetical protein HN352_16050 [Bacteroidetes bacterium]|jgi:hypothetical protein|nr:hypothetical protein [Bacteroidota bacterium]MBT4400804.1 hypothetical protein [Bacteroidota bacterium]MBT4410988.1 hypothetical protein [Bacteroidota bacterium]
MMYYTQIKIIGLIVLFIAMTSFLHAQEEDEIIFTADPVAFTSELSNFLSSIPDKQSRVMIKDFETFKASYMPEENEWISIASIANLLVSLDAKPLSYFSRFINSINSFAQTSLSKYSLTNLLEAVQFQLQKPSPSLLQADNLLHFANRLNSFQELFQSGTIAWTLTGNNWSIEKDTSICLSFTNSTLTGKAVNESSPIYNLTARYYPLQTLLVAQQGHVNWESVNISSEEVYAELGDFKIDLSRSVYSIDSVLLTDKRYFDQALIGRFENKVVTGMPPSRRGYPKFSSYKRINQIKSIYANMDYTGGFTLQGSKVIGADIYNNKGTLLIYYDNRPFMRLASTYFLFTPTRARGVNTEVSMYFDSDSIFHPGLSFQYQKNRNELALMRDGLGLSNSRFFNTYHNLDLDVEMIVWHPGDSIMVLSGMVGSLENQANFESADYFSIQRFNEILLADKLNPLFGVKNCAEYYNSRVFTSGELAEFMNRPHHLVEEMLLNVSFLGFVRFDSQTGMIEVNQRTYDFLDKHAELQDYDIIRFQSDIPPPTPNGYLYIPSGRLKINGVKYIDLSTARSVRAYPSGNQISVYKNRTIKFDGFVQAGLLSFTGQDFRLEYAPFRIYMNHIDQIKLKVHIPRNDDYSDTYITDISSIIENTRGSLYIDAPRNKSGMKQDDYPEFPMFIADTSAFIYYDQSFVQHGAYERDSFYFSTNNLVIRGLNSVYLKDSLSFPGQFRTAGIFPKINLNLEYRDDNSLGFSTLFTPDSGYAVYGDKGRFYNEIEMSNKGLIGDGVLEYLEATLVSDAFLFLPDELRTTARGISVTGDVDELGNPDTKGSDIDIAWEPFENRMNATPKDSLLSVYGDVEFDGKMTIEPEGIQGKGSLSMEEYTIVSDHFSFYQNSLTADMASLKIHSQYQQEDPNNKEKKDDLVSDKTRIRVDFNNKTIELSPEESGSSISFPENQFKSLQTSLSWKIGDPIVHLSDADYISLNNNQNGLKIHGQSSTFSRVDYSIQIEGVESIEVADAVIFPGLRKATIRTKAHIDSMPGCRIIGANPKLDHSIVNALVNITGKNNYKAKGEYLYSDMAGREFLIPIEEVSVRNGISVGSGQLAVYDAFFLSPEFAFKGKVEFRMNNELLLFNGNFQLTHPCTASTKKWIKLNKEIDPNRVIIPIENGLTDDNNEIIHSGFLLSNQPVDLYSSFLGPHTRYSDQPVLESDGFIIFDYNRGEYRIARSDKLESPEMLLPEIKLNRDICQVSGEGPLNLGMEFGQVNISSAGHIKHDLTTDSLQINAILGFDFHMNDRAMDLMAESLNNFTQASAINYADSKLRRSLLYYLGAEVGEQVLNQLGLMGGFRKLPSELKHSILFTKLDLSWNSERGSYVSNGKIGISNIMGKAVNKLFTGKVELVHRRGGDTFTIYIETDPQSYFFLTYSRGLLQVVAGPEYEKFNDLVRDTKESKRKTTSEITSIPYQYYTGQYRLVRNFLNQFNE